MQTELFIEYIQPPKRDKNLLLRCFRYTTATVLAVIFICLLSFSLVTWVIYLTSWGVILTLLYFTTVSLSYHMSIPKRYSKGLLAGAWGLNYGITIIYWFYVYPRIEVNLFISMALHLFPVLVTLIDYAFSRFNITRSNYFIPFGLLASYSILNFVYTLTQKIEIYPGITYTNTISYLIISGAFIIMLLMLELGKFTKPFLIRKLSNSSLHKPKPKSSEMDIMPYP